MREASAVSPILDDFGGDERTRTADPLLAKHALGNALTCGFARRGGQGLRLGWPRALDGA
jgi:hypothetical protein